MNPGRQAGRATEGLIEGGVDRLHKTRVVHDPWTKAVLGPIDRRRIVAGPIAVWMVQVIDRGHRTAAADHRRAAR